jgi:glycosyltransferase involved in cell wall biosynthesis
MTEKPQISVILPFYNAEKTLARAVESIRSQSFPFFELILVNNNSDDLSRNIALQYTKEDSRCRLIDEKTQGVMHAMNSGIEASNARYIARMDSDDISLPHRLEMQYNFLEENPGTGLVGGKVEHVGHNDNTKGLQTCVDWANSFTSHENIELFRFIEIPVVNPTIMFRRELVKSYGGCRDGEFPEDYEMLLRWLDAGVKMEKLDSTVLKWHDSDTRLTRTDERYSSWAFYRIKTFYLARWLKKHNRYFPKVKIWGAGRISRKRAALLENEGVIIDGYIDIDKNKQKDNCIHHSQIAPPGNYFILSYVGKRGARIKIREFLNNKNYTEGKDYLFVS